jgi:hypothetical protein
MFFRSKYFRQGRKWFSSRVIFGIHCQNYDKQPKVKPPKKA